MKTTLYAGFWMLTALFSIAATHSPSAAVGEVQIVTDPMCVIAGCSVGKTSLGWAALWPV